MAWLQPRAKEAKWTHLFYLLYAAFLFVEPAVTHAGLRTWGIVFGVFVTFVTLYVTYLWGHPRLAPWCTVAIAALGFAYWPFNSGASAFFIFAAALTAHVFQPRVAFTGMAMLVAGAGVEIWLVHPLVWYWAATSILIVGIGGMNVHESADHRANAKLRLAQSQIEHLAKIAERERIARDLHDVLGHTLSVIVLKSELASKLLDRDLERTRREILDLEQISRDALAEVRHAIGGYRAGSLTEEISHARSTLATAGMRVDCEMLKDAPSSGKLSPAQETVLALVMREAVTNIVRHSGARNCRIRFAPDGDYYRLEIQDDGLGGSHREGNGLRGMRERIEALDGTITLEGSHGTRLTVIVPLRRKQERIA